MKDMCEPYWGEAVRAWPVGIDTDLWQPSVSERKTIDVLLYDKVRWEHERYDSSLVEPIRAVLRKGGRTFVEIRYGYYREQDFLGELSRCRTMIFLCEHETQGIAYQQALSCNVPILAWDRSGPWQDPAYFPDKVVFEPVTSVPYWDDRCGRRFVGASDFEPEWQAFWESVSANRYRAREFILEHLTLEKCARDYLEIVRQVSES
jgi:glycosyltransferase involved in cell wall biosynthesis